jgi:hypothetical protein
MIVVWGRHEGLRLRVAAVTGAATDLLAGGRGLELGEKRLIDLLAHAHHYAGAVFHGVVVGGEVEVADCGGRRGVLGVAVVALYAELVFELVHDGDDLVTGEVLGEDLEIGGLGAGTVGAGLLGRGGVGGRGGRGLGWGIDREGKRDEGGGRCEKGGSKELRHPVGSFDRERMEATLVLGVCGLRFETE